MIALLCLLGLGTAAVTSGAEVHLYWPIVYQQTDFLEDPPQYRAHAWRTTLSLFNPSSKPAAVTIVGSFGYVFITPMCVSDPLWTPIIIQPDSGHEYWGPAASTSSCLLERVPVAFVELAVDRDIVANGEVERYETRGGCGGGNPARGEILSLGRVSIPVYRETFPPDSTVVMGEVDLGQPVEPERCKTPEEAYLRRVNLTMMNAGDKPAVFTLKVKALQHSSDVLYQATYTVPARDTVQVNQIPIPLVDIEGQTRSNTSYRVWLTLTADQPFLCYASSIFETNEPGTLPFEVFPARLVK